MKIFISGKNGNLGQSLIKELANTNLDFLALNRDELDITDRQAVIASVNNYRPDIIINTAAYTQVEKAELEPAIAYQTNCNGAKNLADAARLVNAPIFHISTDYIFSGDGIAPYKEQSPAKPHTVYGQSKLAGELAITKNNPHHIILRTSWLFSEYGNNFLRTILRLGKEQQELSVVMDQRGSPTYAGDLSRVLIQLAQRYRHKKKLPWGTYHYSGAPYVSWYEFTLAIVEQAVRQEILVSSPVIKPICSSDYPSRVKRPLNSRLDCHKIHDIFGIAPSNWHAVLHNRLAAFL